MIHIYKIEYKNDYKGNYWDEESKINAEPIIYLYGRDDDKNKVIKEIRGFKPYFYVERDKVLPDAVMKYIVGSEDKEYITVKGERCQKVFTQNPRNVKIIREILDSHGVTTYEDDVVFVLRFLIDEKENLEKSSVMDLNGWWRQLTIDIETTSEFGFPEPKEAKEKITIVGCYDNYTTQFTVFAWHENLKFWKEKFTGVSDRLYKEKGQIVEFRLFDNEYEMLTEWLKYYQILNPDLLLGWNSEQFDIPYIINRLDNLKIDKKKLAVNNGWVSNWLQDEKWFQPSITGRVIFDVMKYYKDTIMNEKPSYSLDNVAKDELGESKLPIKNHMEAWQNDFLNYVLYNIVDVDLCTRIAEKRDMVKFVNGLRDMVGCNFDDFKYFSRLVDLMILQFAKKENIILPSRRRVEGEYIPKDKREAQFEGAHVLAEPGLYKNVCALDIKTLYPLTIKTLNISYETITDDNSGEIKIGEHYYRKEKGLLARVVDNILQISSKYKTLRNEADANSYDYEKYSNLYECAKFIVVTLYGAQGNNTFRLFDMRNAESITYVGRKIIQHTQSVLEKEGHKVILIDTDSCYINLLHSNNTPEECIKEGERLRDLVNKSYDDFAKQFNVKEHFFEIKFEMFYRSMIVATKKNYAGVQEWREGKWEKHINIKGLQAVKSNTARKTKIIQSTVLDIDRKSVV